jgi:hypothetical protein
MWRVDEILGATLPLELVDTSPTSFSQVGHIGEYTADINVIEELMGPFSSPSELERRVSPTQALDRAGHSRRESPHPSLVIKY